MPIFINDDTRGPPGGRMEHPEAGDLRKIPPSHILQLFTGHNCFSIEGRYMVYIQLRWSTLKIWASPPFRKMSFCLKITQFYAYFGGSLPCSMGIQTPGPLPRSESESLATGKNMKTFLHIMGVFKAKFIV